MTTSDIVSLKTIYEARSRIRRFVRRTPLLPSPELSSLAQADVRLKLENVQLTRSFKPRGVANKLLCLSQAELERGVVAVSTGNHGKAVAHVARELGGRAVICVSQGVPDHKRQAIEAAGGEAVVAGADYDEATETMQCMVEERGLVPIGSFKDELLAAGHATIGLELVEDFPEVDTVIVPVANGMLLAGIAKLVKTVNPSAKAVGVSMERGAVLIPSLRKGRIVDFQEKPTLADAIMGGLGPHSEFILELLRRYMDEGVLVSEDEIAEGMSFALHRHHQIVEGAGAVGIAALLSQKVSWLGQHVAVVVTGGNVDIEVLCDVAREKQSGWT